MKEIEITAAPLALHQLLKFENLVGSGGEAKHVIAAGLVAVNGAVETRKNKKIHAGDVIEFGGQQYRVRIQGDKPNGT
nr:RNA-binding S4 domain-containing protein [Desulfatitalea alkaliphila]